MTATNHFRFTIILFLSLFSCALFAQTVDQINIEGNLQTRSEIIQQELLLTIGTEITPQALERSRQNIMDLGLFESVDINSRQLDEQTLLVVKVREKKHDWYILPRLDRNGDGDIGLGFNWRAGNMNGLNQKSKLTLLYKTFEDASKKEETRLSYHFDYPRIIGTPWSSYASFRLSHVGLEEERNGLTGNYDRDEVALGFGLGKWFAKTGISKGYKGDIGFQYQHFGHKYLSGEPGFYDSADIFSIVANLRYSKVKDLLYSRDGHAIGLTLEMANDALLSDRTYFYQQLYYKRYISVANKAHTNFNIQIQLANGDRSIFGDPIYELSGDRTLRGYPRETLEGSAYFLVNTEFLTPIFNKNSVRGGFMFDFGNAYPSLSDIKDLDFEYGVGFSLRWQLRQWVDTQLRIDYARGLGDEGASRVYVTGNALF